MQSLDKECNGPIGISSFFRLVEVFISGLAVPNVVSSVPGVCRPRSIIVVEDASDLRPLDVQLTWTPLFVVDTDMERSVEVGSSRKITHMTKVGIETALSRAGMSGTMESTQSQSTESTKSQSTRTTNHFNPKDGHQVWDGSLRLFGRA